MKPKQIFLVLSGVLLALFLLYSEYMSAPTNENHESGSTNDEAGSSTMASISQKTVDPKVHIKQIEVIQKTNIPPERIKEAEGYFKKVTSDPKTNSFYLKSQRLFGADSPGDGASRWMTLGIVFVTSEEYSDALHLAMKEFNSQPEILFERIQQNISEIRRDPFLFQMTLNLVYQLRVDTRIKVDFMGSEIEYQLANLGEKPSESFWVSLNSMTLLKQAGVETKDIQGFIQRGLQKGRGSEKARSDFATAAKSFFPNLEI